MRRSIEITTSQINEFKNCRYRYYLSYKAMLKPREQPEALTIGSSYHAKVEQILKTGSFEKSYDYTDSMARAFIKYIQPQLGNIVDVEKEFRTRIGYGIYLKGKIDAISDKGLIEHKTLGRYIDDEYIYKVHYQNSQVSNYLIGTQKNVPITYTVISKPTIRIKKTETMEEYLQRCDEWYDVDTDRKIAVFEVYRTDDELKEAKAELLNFAKEMKNCTNYYRNDRACSIIGCPFSSICYADDLDNLVDFTKKERINEELDIG